MARPPRELKWLLAGTAFAGGIMAAAVVLPSGEALAASSCGALTPNGPINHIGAVTCDGDTPADNHWYSLLADADGWSVKLGPDGVSNPYINNYNTTSSDPVFYLVANTHSGSFEIFDGSSIDHTGATPGDALRILAVTKQVDVKVDAGASMKGKSGILISGNNGGYVTITNNGHIAGSNATADGDGYFGNAVEISKITSKVDNHSYGSMIGHINGIKYGGLGSGGTGTVGDVDFDNSGGLLSGQTGSGLYAIHVNGVGTTDDDQPLVNVKNGHGGVIAGGTNGVYVSDVTGTYGSTRIGVTIDNAGDALGSFSGGLIVGGSDGVYVTDVDHGGLYINNQNTLDGFIASSGPVGSEVPFGALDPLVYNPVTPATGPYQLQNLFADLVTDGTFTGIIGAGDDGIDASHIHGGAQVDNQNGLTLGLDGDGISLSYISNYGSADAVQINNGNRGLIAGYGDGIDIEHTYGNGAQVVVDNSGASDGSSVGGLIYGEKGQGIDISHTSSDVIIKNDSTLFDTIDFKNITADNVNILDGISDVTAIVTGITSGTPALNSVPTGIIGAEGGIKLAHIGGYSGTVDISNQQGLIVSYGSGPDSDGINIRDVEGRYVPDSDGLDNSHYEGVNYNGTNGLLFGRDDGLQYRDIDGNVNTINDGGIILGLGNFGGTEGDGANISDVWRGDVYFSNAGGGIIAGLTDGIKVSGVDGHWNSGDQQYYGGGAYVANGIFSDPDTNPDYSTSGGLILGLKTAISLRGVEEAYIGNGAGGWIIGKGGYHSPVISLNASRGGDKAGSVIDNYGVISSYHILNSNVQDLFSSLSTSDGFADAVNTLEGIQGTADVLPALENLLDAQKIFDDVDDLNAFAWSGGNSGSVDNLPDYTEAASDLAVQSDWSYKYGSNGATQINNYGLLVGRVDLEGYTWDDGRVGNGVVNYGTWITHGRNTLEGSSSDYIENHGLIQTATLGDASGWTGFTHLNDFYNGAYPDLDALDTLDQPTASPGLISSIDDGAGDRTWISGNFHGGYTDAPVTSYIGVDTYFTPDSPDGAGGKSDKFIIGGDIDGSTGLIIHQVSDVPSGYIYNDGWIPVVKVLGADQNWNSGGNNCSYTLCKEGDAVFISSASQGYVNVGGYGAVEDGFNHAWYLTEWGYPENGPSFNLVNGGDAPNAIQIAGLTTGAQNIYYDTAGVAADHVYGNHFPSSGPGGADLAADYSPTPSAGDGVDHKTGLWAKITGNWDDRDTSINENVLGNNLSIDTGFNQDTYSVLGGADFSPNGERNGFRAGVYGGYVSSNLDFTSYGASADYKGGVVGGYAAFTNGGFYVDTEVSADFLNIDYQAPAIGLGNTASVDGTTVGVIANTGYRFQNNWGFIEPIASLAYANTSIDNLNGGGSTVDFSNGESFRAGAGARIGTSFATTGGTRTEVSILGKVWNEFEDANKVTITNNTSGDTATFSDDISGVFGEVSATATTWTPGRAWSGFVTGGAKFSDAFTDWNAQVGLRRNF